MDVIEVKYWTVTRRMVQPESGGPAYAVYTVPGFGEFRWAEFLELTNRLNADARNEAREASQR